MSQKSSVLILIVLLLVNVVCSLHLGLEHFNQQLKNLGDKLEHGAHHLKDEIKEKGNDLADGAHHLEDEIKEKGDDLADGAHHLENEIKDSGDELTDHLTDEVHHLGDDIEEGINSEFMELKDHLKQSIQNRLQDLKQEAMQQLLEELKHVDWEEMLGDVLSEEKLTPVLHKAEDDLLGYAEEKLGEATGLDKDGVIAGFQNMEHIVAKLSKVFKDIDFNELKEVISMLESGGLGPLLAQFSSFEGGLRGFQ